MWALPRGKAVPGEPRSHGLLVCRAHNNWHSGILFSYAPQVARAISTSGGCQTNKLAVARLANERPTGRARKKLPPDKAEFSLLVLGDTKRVTHICGGSAMVRFVYGSAIEK